MLQAHEITEAEKYAVSDWHYTDEYAIYNLPPYAEIKGTGRGLDRKGSHFISFSNESKLVGYVNLVEEPCAVFIGIGVAPDCCGQGYGREMLADACRISRAMFPGKTLYLEVRAWNERAIRCYQAAGFHIDGAAFTQTTPIGAGSFYRMVR